MYLLFMTHTEYTILKQELQQLVKQTTLLNWGKIQNDKTDAQLDIFKINSYIELENAVANFNDKDKNYFVKRWLVWKCSKCDEYLFCLNKNVLLNPQHKDQTYDIEFNNDSNLRFDIKGTVIPKQFRNDVEKVIKNPKFLIDFFYEKQSKGVRHSFQNRLFIVHHSFKKQEREIYLRCHFDFKEEVYKNYANAIGTGTSFINYSNAKADIIFIIENSDGSFEGKIASQEI